MNSAIGVAGATPVAPLPGRCTCTNGCDVSSVAAVVVNAPLKSASAFPFRSRTSLVATTVTTLAAGSSPPVNVTVR
jgi:hypothetical protein